MELVQDVTDEYGDLTIPEFIDALIKDESEDLEENLNEETLNEERKYLDYRSDKEVTNFLIPLVKTSFKHIKVKAFNRSGDNDGVMTIEGPDGKDLGSF